MRHALVADAASAEAQRLQSAQVAQAGQIAVVEQIARRYGIPVDVAPLLSHRDSQGLEVPQPRQVQARPILADLVSRQAFQGGQVVQRIQARQRHVVRPAPRQLAQRREASEDLERFVVQAPPERQVQRR